MKAIIYQPRPRARRIKFFIPYKAMEWRAMVKAIDGVFYHSSQKSWSIPYTDSNMEVLKGIFGSDHELCSDRAVAKMPHKALHPDSINILSEYEQKIILKGYSDSTRKSYTNAFAIFLSYFEEHDMTALSKAQIEGYIYHLKSKYRVSDTKQNIVINAIKFYYEHVLGAPKAYCDIQRPKRAISLPNVLSPREVIQLINAPTNIKHRAILYTIYSAGLRISEVINVRLEDVRADQGYIFVKGGKGKKDRKTILSDVCLTALRTYCRAHRPSYWLFEGADGDRYSKSSVTKIFRRAVSQAQINPWATVHTLRHSFATHLLQQGVNLRDVPSILGHAP